MTDITLHGTTYSGVNAVKYVNGATTYDLDKLVVNGETLWAKSSLLPEKKTFSEMTWADISTVCKAGMASSYWSLGDTKDITVYTNEDGDTRTDTVRIIGFDHDTPTDTASYGRAKAGITLQTVNVVDRRSMYNSTQTKTSSTFGDTKLYNYLDSSIYDYLMSDLRSVITPVDKLCVSVTSNSTSIVTLSSNLFILSTSECRSSSVADGTLYAYYDTNGCTKTDTSGNSVAYWTRTARLSANVAGYQYITTSGGASSTSALYTSRGVAYAFCV